MPYPHRVPTAVVIAFVIAYLVGNLMLNRWLGRRWMEERISRRRLALIYLAGHFGPFLLVAVYMVAVQGSGWTAVVAVGVVAVIVFWTLEGLLGYSERTGVREAMRAVRPGPPRKPSDD